MAENDDVRPIESDDTYTYDETLPGYRTRTRTASTTYREMSNPSDFEPAPAEPEDDPDPPEEGDDISPSHSARVAYYDNLSATHRDTTATEVTRFGGELADYADYYNANIKKPGEPNYQMPVSQVQPLDVTGDGAERANESNLVGDYDVASNGYSAISVGSTGRTEERGATYSESMDAAEEKFDALLSETGENSIAGSFEDLTDYYDETHNETGSGATSRSDMSVMEAGTADIRTTKGNMDNFKSSVMGSGSNPGTNTVNGLAADIGNRVDNMVNNVKNGLIDISEYNTMSNDMMGYIRQNKTYSQFVSARGSLYSGRFTDAMMRTCWNTNYNNYHS